MRAISLCLLLLLSSPAVIAQAPLADTTTVVWRQMDAAERQAYFDDSDYQYGRPQEGLTAWQRFWMWFFNLLTELYRFATETLLGQILTYTLCFIFVVWVIMRLLNVEVKNLFYPQTKAGGQVEQAVAGDIQEIDFERAIGKAVHEGDFREAIRLTFLFALRKLADQGRIKLVAGKTNDEYLMELGQHPARLATQTLRYYFDYTWYGDFKANEEVYRHVSQTFRDFNSRLS